MKRIAIGCDHAGFPLKDRLVTMLKGMGYEVEDFGTHNSESVDYPDFVHPVADSVESGKSLFGIVMCGSGNGVAMTANKHQGIRAALCWAEELAALARQHNNANILALPIRFVSEELALKIVLAFLHAEFEGGRHQGRIEKIPCC
jgi:ribose 5-phosphate isomerase B